MPRLICAAKWGQLGPTGQQYDDMDHENYGKGRGFCRGLKKRVESRLMMKILQFL